MNPSEPFIRLPVGTTLLAVGLFLLGAIAYVFLPVASLPAVEFPNQAKFHPRKYLRFLAEKIPGNGSHVFERSAASEFDSKKHRVEVNGR